MPKKKQHLERAATNRRLARSTSFKKGDGRPRGAGRRKGQQNRTTTLLKDAILMAASIVGEDGHGKGELVGYLTMLARKERVVYARMLERVLPMQIAVHNPPSKYTPAEAIERLKEKGLPVPPMLMSLAGGTDKLNSTIANGVATSVAEAEDYEDELNGVGRFNEVDVDEPLDDDSGEPIGTHTR